MTCKCKCNKLLWWGVAIAVVVVYVGFKVCNTAEAFNPFYSEFNTPYNVPDFKSIQTEHYLPAIDKGIEEVKGNIKNIVERKDPPTFENTVAELEYANLFLTKVAAVFHNIAGTDSTSELQKLELEVSVKLSNLYNEIIFNNELFAKVKSVYEERDSLSLEPESDRLLERTYKDFVRNGVNLPKEQQKQLAEINTQISKLETEFSNNLLSDTKIYKLVVDDKSELSGLDSDVVESFAQAAKADGKDSKWLLTADKPVVMAVLTFADSRELRKELLRAYSVKGNQNNQFDNKNVISDIIKLRIKKAKLLGHENYAQYVLEDTMAKTPQAASALMMQVWEKALRAAKKERDALTQFARESGAGKDFKLEAWDWFYYAEKLKKKRFDIDDSDLKPYFEFSAVREGAFTVINKLYGLKFIKRDDIPTYYKDVQAFEVQNNVGDHVGVLYMDFFTRGGKRAGAWMSEFRSQYKVKDASVAPVVVTVFNFAPPTDTAPALLSSDDVITVFHELGHATHGLLSNCVYPSLSGTSVSRDFVELPSQLLEHWAFHKEVLPLYAKHYKTGEIIPDALVQKLKKIGSYNQGFVKTEFLSAALLDMQWHTITEELDNIDVVEFENKTLRDLGMIDEIVVRYKSPYFLHIFSHGYDAGYYSYLWSDVLDSDAFSKFEKNGVFDQATAKLFVDEILTRGNTREPDISYEKFMGRKPDSSALIKELGFN